MARRIAPPWPVTEGTAYDIPLGPDGCPIIREPYRFVDAPGPFVPPDPIEVVLCTVPTTSNISAPDSSDPPRQQVLRTGAAGYLYEYSYVFRYQDGSSVPLVSRDGTGGLTTGARTRMDSAKPHVFDDFMKRFHQP